jgi:alpha-tubulin suppressor-like RCC1 family protein
MFTRVTVAEWQGRHVVAVACGRSHTAIVLSDGALFTCGDDEKVSGHGGGCVIPMRVAPVEWQGRRVVAVACGAYHTGIVLDDGALFTFGAGQRGELGQSDKKGRKKPARVEWSVQAGEKLPLPAVAGVTFSDTHAVVWTPDGRVFCWGADAAHGKLGKLGKLGPAPSAVGSVDEIAVDLHSGDHMSAVEKETLLPHEVAGLPRTAQGGCCRCAAVTVDCVAEAVAGPDHCTYARTHGGRVYVWGRGLGRQLGLGATERDHAVPRLMGPVQGRVVTGIFVAHDGAVWLSCAADGAERKARADDEALPRVVRNPLELLQGADLEAGDAHHDALATTDQGRGAHGNSAQV